MSFSHESLWNLNTLQLDYLTINTSQLEITMQLFPNLIHPRLLTTNHVNAIKASVRIHFFDPDSIMIADPSTLIKQSVAYGQYRNSLKGKQFEPQDARELFDHFIRNTPGMNISQFRECVKNWSFIENLHCKGEEAQKKVLETGWTAYSLVPHHLKIAFGLIKEE